MQYKPIFHTLHCNNSRSKNYKTMYLNLKEARLINERIRLCTSLLLRVGFEARSRFVDFVSEKLGPNAICRSVFFVFFIPFKF